MPPKESTIDDGSLPDTHIIPYSPAVKKLLLKPSKATICETAITWLRNPRTAATHPPPEDLEDDEYEEEELSVEQLIDIYMKMMTGMVTRKVVVDRIMERDWNRGLTLWQIANLECCCIVDNSLALKWTAGLLSPQGSDDSKPFSIPRFQASSFIYNLQKLIKPIVKTHCYTYHYRVLSLVILRIQLHEPMGDAQSYEELPPPKRILFCAFPRNMPYILWNVGFKDPLRAVVLDSLAAAISYPGKRYELKSTSLTTKNLSAIYTTRIASRSSHALGAWSLYADDKVDKSPLDSGLGAMGGGASGGDQEEEETMTETEEVRVKRRKIAEGRFGTSGIIGDGAAIEKLEVTLKDQIPALNNRDDETADQGQAFRPTVAVKFEGPHVFAGIRTMIEHGIVDGEAMPGWMTGEDGVNVGVVKDRKVLKRADKWY